MSAYLKAFSEGFISYLCGLLFVSLYELIYDTHQVNKTTNPVIEFAEVKGDTTHRKHCLLVALLCKRSVTGTKHDPQTLHYCNVSRTTVDSRVLKYFLHRSQTNDTFMNKSATLSVKKNIQIQLMILACLMDLVMGFVLERGVMWSQIAPMFKHKHAQNLPCDSSSHFRHRDSSEF